MNQDQLRFEKFNKIDWQTKRVSQILKRVVNPVNVEQDVQYKQIGIRSHGKGIFHKELVSGKEIGNKRIFWLEKDLFIVNIVFAWERAIARTTVKEIGLVASHRFPMYRPIENEAYLDYLLHFFLTKRGNQLLELASPGGAGRNKTLGQKEFEKLSFSIPSFPEQQKIADYLSSVDQKISLLDEKKTELSRYKKAMMHQLFSQQIRFKDENGNDFPDWEEKRLGEVGYFQTSSVDKLYVENEKEVYLINYMNVYRHETINNETINSFQIVTAKDSQIKSSDIKKGDILFTPSSETPSDIGHSVVIFEDIKNAVFSYHLMRFRPSIELNLMYSHYFCNISKVLNQLTKYATGSTRFTISVKSFSAILVDIPSIPEQQKIADFLSSLDESIDKVNEQIKQMKNFKKAMLQQMFV